MNTPRPISTPGLLRRDRGFAVLLVFVMAATICIFLYMQMPRVAFEAMRAKEEMLIERGEQYKRAIQLFVRQNKNYPSKIEDLENFNGKRYLRQRYKDPMTGKDDWRIIHVGPGGVLLDSLVQKPQTGAEKTEPSSKNTFITEGPSLAGVDQSAPGAGANLALRTRPSERPGAPGSGGPSPFTPVPGAPPGPGDVPQDPSALRDPGSVILTPRPEAPAQGFSPPAPQPGLPGTPYPPAQPGAPPAPNVTGQLGQPQPYVAGLPGVSPNQFQPPAQPPVGVAPQGAPGPSYIYPGQASAPGSAAPPPTPTPTTPPANPALEMIQKLLTTPRPGGLPGSSASPTQTVGGGIAGFASKYEGDSIKVYRGRAKYNEWEFIYDIKEDLQKAAAAVGAQMGAPSQQGQIPGQAPKLPTTNAPAPRSP